MKAREASAPSPLRQISYKMWQMLLSQHCKGQIRTRRKRLIQTWKMNTSILDEGSPDQFMFHAFPDVQVFQVRDEFGDIESSASSSDEDDIESPNPAAPTSNSNRSECKAVVMYILLILQLAEILA